jgi:hypothetical integral membrane protein (TIGR02206 family)
MTNDPLCNSSTAHLQSCIIATEFHAFDAQHIITLIIIVVLCLLVAKAARREELSRNTWLRVLIALSLLSYTAFFYIQQGMKGSLSWEYSLPLELCNIVMLACLISLFRPNQLATEIAYYWGLGGVLQATATPDLARGFPSLDFILFFWSHGTTLIAIAFLIMSHDFRPRNCSIVRMMVALNIYGLVIGSADAVMEWNYGYLCWKPFVPSLLDLLGPWPWYLLSLEMIALLTFLILDVPWRFRSWGIPRRYR